jgi:hypothetical protein
LIRFFFGKCWFGFHLAESPASASEKAERPAQADRSLSTGRKKKSFFSPTQDTTPRRPETRTFSLDSNLIERLARARFYDLMFSISAFVGPAEATASRSERAEIEMMIGGRTLGPPQWKDAQRGAQKNEEKRNI